MSVPMKLLRNLLLFLTLAIVGVQIQPPDLSSVFHAPHVSVSVGEKAHAQTASDAGGIAGATRTALYPGSTRLPHNTAFEGQSVTHGAVTAVSAVASITGSTMTVSSLATGYYIEPGAEVVFPGVPANTTVLAYGTNSATAIGQAGTYQLSNSVSGTISGTMSVNIPQVFGSLRKPGVSVPLPGARSLTGGSLFRYIDDMWDWGYDEHVVNGAKGSMSLTIFGSGYLSAWNPNSNSFYQQRTPQPPYDRGFFGSMINPFGQNTWVCTTGRPVSVMGGGVFFSPGASSLDLDFMQFPDTGFYKTSGAGTTASITAGSNILTATVTTGTITAGYVVQGNGVLNGLVVQPYGTSGTTGTGGTGTYALSGNASSTVTASVVNFIVPGLYSTGKVTAGTTVTDGTYVWTSLGTNNNTPNTALASGAAGAGWDPLGVMAAIRDQMDPYRAGGVRTDIVIDGNQADLGNTTAARQAAVAAVGNYFLALNYGVFIGNQIYSPGSGTIAQHVAENGANAAALAQLQAGMYGANAYAGANLYAVLGTAGPTMGGVIGVTGSVNGNMLTVSSGTGISIGYNVWSGTNLVGVITGGSGTTWTLNGGITTASTSLNIVGTWMQYDGIHLNQQGSLQQGDAYAAVMKAILPPHPTVGFGLDLPAIANDNTPERMAA